MCGSTYVSLIKRSTLENVNLLIYMETQCTNQLLYAKNFFPKNIKYINPTKLSANCNISLILNLTYNEKSTSTLFINTVQDRGRV